MLKQFILIAMLVSGLLSTVYAASNLTATEETEATTIHNKWRSTVGLPTIKWSSTLADAAQEWANTLKTNKACELAHSKAEGLGENLFWASPLMYSDGTKKIQAIAPIQVIDAWGKEVKDYSYSSNTCARGKVCGHYTQVVWKNTTEVGCGKAVCADNSQVWVCNYAPAGNYVGQKPY